MTRFCTIFLLLAFFFSCTEHEQFNYLFVETQSVDYTPGAGATFYGLVENKSDLEIIESGFTLSIRPKDANALKFVNDEHEGSISQETTYPLASDKYYYVRAYAVTQDGTVYGKEQSFKTTGQVNTGQWHAVTQTESFGFCEFINDAFSIDNKTYFLTSDGLYSYNHTTRLMSFVLSNAVINATSFSALYEGNVFLFSTDRFYRFELGSNTLTALAVWPVTTGERYGAATFMIGHDVYIGLGVDGNNEYQKDFWKYDLTTDSWAKIPDFPGNFRSDAFAFTTGNNGYVGGGFNLIDQWPYPKFEDLWQYNSETNQWKAKEDLPFENDDLYNLVSVTNSGIPYLFYQRNFSEYNAIYDFWEPMAPLIGAENLCYPLSFFLQ